MTIPQTLYVSTHIYTYEFVFSSRRLHPQISRQVSKFRYKRKLKVFEAFLRGPDLHK